jgi:hypothetical protein
MSVNLYQTTRCQVPEHSALSHRCNSLRSNVGQMNRIEVSPNQASKAVLLSRSQEKVANIRLLSMPAFPELVGREPICGGSRNVFEI